MPHILSASQIQWKQELNSQEWDNALTTLQGHPLQSAQWGNTKKLFDNINDYRWAAFYNEKPIYLVRFEERRLFKFVKIAWIPKGPTASSNWDESMLQKQLLNRLKKRGYFLCITNPWRKLEEETKISCDYTIWIDLTVGKEKLWQNLDKQFRYDVRRSIKENIIVEQINQKEDVNAFYELCKSISIKKGFTLNASPEIMFNLLQKKDESNVRSYLFAVRHENKICAGAFIMHCGQSIHYLWGAVDRAYSKKRVGEAVQWQVIEWALQNNCHKYDLEGIDTKANPGTYHFKKKMGGIIVALPKLKIYPLHNFLKPISILWRLREILACKFKLVATKLV